MLLHTIQDEADAALDPRNLDDQLALIARYRASGEMSEREYQLKRDDIHAQLAASVPVSPGATPAESQMYRDLGPASDYAA